MQTRKSPAGVHLFDRNSGLNILLDELIPAREEWASAPKTLSIALTNNCNSCCPCCYIKKDGASLNEDDVLGWAKELNENGGQNIGFGGGEPTLHPGLISLCKTISASTNLAVTLTTHGLNFTEELAEKLKDSVHFIRISLGGIFQAYEDTHLRSFTEFQKILPLIKKTAPIGFNILINSNTLRQIDAMMEFALKNDVQEILLLPIVSSSGKLLLSGREKELLSNWINKNYKKRPLSLSAAIGNILSVPILPIEDNRGPSYDFLHIDAHGKIKANAFTQNGIEINSSLNLMDAITKLRHIL